MYRLSRSHGDTVDSLHADGKTPLHLGCKFCPYQSGQSIGEVDALMYAHGAVGKVALYCTAVQTHAPSIWLLLSSEAGKSNDHDDCGLALRCIKNHLMIWVLRHGSDVESLDWYLREWYDRMSGYTSAVYLLWELGAKSMHVHRCTASTQVSADGHAQMADYIRYHGAIAEAHS